jgi:hypothetical protein
MDQIFADGNPTLCISVVVPRKLLHANPYVSESTPYNTREGI